MKKDFEEIYSQMVEKSQDVLEIARKDKNKKLGMTLLICILVNILLFFIDREIIILPMTVALSALVILLVMSKLSTRYRKTYKNFVMGELIKAYSTKLDYTPDVGISKYDYSLSHFDNSFDELYSEDRIFGQVGKNSNLQMAQVITKVVNKQKDVDGNVHTEKTETFNGLYGIVKLEKDLHTKIYIATNSFTQKYNAKRIEMDSAEFEKGFDCFTEDKVLAMKIFTSDLLEKFVDIQRKNMKQFEVKLENDMLYFRMKCGLVFEPPRMKNALDKTTIQKYYDMISYPIDLIEKMIENVNRI